MTRIEDARRTVDTYRDARERVVEFIREITQEYLDRAVPATPLWTGRQLVAHLVGGSEDFANMNLPSAGMSFGQWTANQVARRDGMSMEALLADWDGLLPKVVEMLGQEGAPGVPLIVDTVVHEHDLRGLTGSPSGRDARGYRLARQALARRFESRSAAAGLAPLTIETDDWTVRPNEGEAAGVVKTTSSFEMFRALSGRRSMAQMRAFDWTVSPEPYLEHMPVFGPPAQDLVET